MAQPAAVDDWVLPEAAAPADDWVSPHQPTLDIANIPEPTLRERLGGAIAGIGDGPNSFWAQLARKLVGSSGLGHSETGALDVIPFTAPLFVPGDVSQATNPLEAAAAAAGAIPAGAPAVAGGRAVAQTIAEQQAAAAARRGVTTTRAVDSGLADWVKELPTAVENPVRAAAEREIADLQAAQARTTAMASRNYRPADASRRALNDWLMGRTRADTDAAAEAAALRGPETPAARSETTSAPAAQEIVTPDSSMSVRATPELVELEDLTGASGRLQLRDRARPEYQQEVRERATRLDPEQLRPARLSDTGAPIVLQDGTIISGNGRTASIAEAYTNPALADRAAAYRASLGPEATSMRQPVLVMRAEPMTPEEAQRFGDLSNRGRVAAMSAPERAARDAQALGTDGIALYRGGEFTSPQNAAFLRAFAEHAVTAGERPAFSKAGELTQEGVNRMRAAVLHGAYGDSTLLSRMLESTDDNVRNITGALTDAAPGMVALRADIKAGVVPAELDASGPLTDAVKLIADLRTRGISPAQHFAQADAFAQTDPLAEAWVRGFYNDGLTRPQSRQKMAEVIEAYTTEARKHQAGGLFEDTTTARDVLNVAARRKGEAGDVAQPLLGDLPQAVGPRVRDGGAQARGQGAAEVGADAPAGGPTATGLAGSAEPRLAGAGQAGKPALGAEATAQSVTRNLTELRKAAIAKAIGEPVQGITPELVTQRLTEMARSRLSADVNGLMRAREIIGPEGWRDVTAGILHRLGAVEGGWDLVKFGKAWSEMTKTGRQVLFGGKGMPRGYMQALDDLATLSERMPRLQKLTQSIFPLIVEALIRHKATSVLGHVLLHPLSGGTSVLVQASGWALAKFISRPMMAPRVSMLAQAMADLAQHNTPRNVAVLKFATQQLLDAAGGDDGTAR